MGSYRLCIIGMLLMTAVAVAGCSEDDETVAGLAAQDAFIVGYVVEMGSFIASEVPATAAAPSDLVECSSQVSVSNVISLPEVTLNGVELLAQSMPRGTSSAPIPDPVEYPLLAIGPAAGGLSYYGNVWIDEEDDAHLVVEYARSGGSTVRAEATVCVPGPFSILEVTNGGNITPTSSVMAEWSSSDDAEKYYIYGSGSCNYRTLSEETLYMSFRCDTVVTDTTFIFQGEDVFPSPPDLYYFVSLDGYFYITPVCGPIEPGDMSNVTGDGDGFFTGLGPSRQIHLLYMPRTSAVDTDEKN